VADYTTLINLFIAWGLGIISSIIFQKYSDQSQMESDKRTLVNELNQILQTQETSTWVQIKTDVFDDLRTRSYYSSLPQEKRNLIEKLYSKILSKNNLIEIKNRHLIEGSKLGTTGSEIVIGDGENKIFTPINRVITDIRKMIEEDINKLLKTL